MPGAEPRPVLRHSGEVAREFKDGELLIRPVRDIMGEHFRPGRPLNIMIDGGVSYRLATEVVYSVALLGFADLRFGIDDSGRSAFVPTLPQMATEAELKRDDPPLNLTVAVRADGVELTAGERSLPCSQSKSCRVAAGDWPSLTKRASAVKAEFPGEFSVMLSADPKTPFRAVVAAAAALRGEDKAPLFPSVMLTVAP